MKVVAGVGSNTEYVSNQRYSRQGGEHEEAFDDVRTIKSVKKPYFQIEICQKLE